VPIIYALLDPRDGVVRYIGYSKNRPSQRLAHHVCHAIEGSKTPCACWVRELLSEGKIPDIITLKIDATFEDEVAEISARRAAGEPILNVNNGGPGAPGKRGPMSIEQRQKISAALKGRKLPSEQIEARRGRKMPPRTDAHRAALSTAKTGTKASKETLAKLSASHMGKPWNGISKEGLARRGIKVAEAKARIRVERFGEEKIYEAIQMMRGGARLYAAAEFLGCTNKTMRRLFKGTHRG
jgi:hypothetical protein